MNTNTSSAPFPTELEHLVDGMRYRPEWVFGLHPDLDRGQGSRGCTLIITTCGYNAYHPDEGQDYRVTHFMPVPPAAFNRASWQRWLLDQCLLVDRHEACEFFAIDGDHPYAPHHGPGNDPYIVWDHGDDVDRRTSFRGDVKEA